QLLGGLGYRIVAAEDAAAALAVIDRGEAFDLLFTDLVMPGAMNGIDLAREVRRRFPAMPIVFTSGFSDPETIRTEAASLRATIIGKPYRKSELATHLRAMLDRGPLSGA
ncbi:MAG: response regulator, partial [Proteobacteria bacterium]|nr:response regulator [Pseudomonadota bacterium]